MKLLHANSRLLFWSFPLWPSSSIRFCMSFAWVLKPLHLPPDLFGGRMKILLIDRIHGLFMVRTHRTHRTRSPVREGVRALSRIYESHRRCVCVFSSLFCCSQSQFPKQCRHRGLDSQSIVCRFSLHLRGASLLRLRRIRPVLKHLLVFFSALFGLPGSFSSCIDTVYSSLPR